MYNNITIPQDTVDRVLAEALSRGGHYADIFAENTHIGGIALQDGVVSQAAQSVLYGAGVRTLYGDKTGYAYTMDLDERELIRAAQSAACIADGQTLAGGSPYVCSETTAHRGVTDSRYPMLRSWSDVGVGERKDLLMNLDDYVHSLDARVVKVRAALNNRLQHVFFANNLGESFTDVRPRATLIVMVVMCQNGQTEMGYASESLMMGAEFISEERMKRVARKAVEHASVLFDAVQPEGGEMPVVMAAGASGILLHEAIGHAFEADFNRKGTSIFADKLGQMICSPDITIVDDGTRTADQGALNWDDEGVSGQRTVLVDHGRLHSYMHDRISAAHYGVAPTGNGRRESFRSVPVPRMRSTYMLAGDASEEDVIRSVKRGIYAESFTNGQVQIGAGDFTFYMKQGRLIEDGKLTRPIRDINIIGNGPQALADISMVADNLIIDPSSGMCGKEGQSVPVSQGLPTVLVNRLTVGGVG